MKAVCAQLLSGDVQDEAKKLWTVLEKLSCAAPASPLHVQVYSLASRDQRCAEFSVRD